jgi:hypothetical protein
MAMLALDLSGFFVMLMLSVFAAAVMHYAFHYYVMPGFWSFVSKVIIGFVGGVFGPAVFGHWFPVVGGIPIFPAMMGSFALIFFVVDATASVNWKGAH